jgi:hypothetical protein
MSFHEQVQVIGHDPPAVLAGLRADQLLTPAPDPASQDWAVVLRAPHGLIREIIDTTCANLHLLGHAGDYTDRLCQFQRFPHTQKTAVPREVPNGRSC